MYSDILRILDRNTERNMVTDLQGVVDELKDENIELKDENTELKGKNTKLKAENTTLKLRLITQIQKKMKKGNSLSEIADALELDMQELEPIYSQIQRLGTDCDAQDILKALADTPKI